MITPFPADVRSLLEAFRFYETTIGLDSVFGHIDFANVRPRDVYRCAHDRLPDRPQNTVAWPGYDPKAHLRAAIESDEFQRNILRLFLEAFPERQRLVFIHVPKCAGTHLHARLSSCHRTLPTILTDRSWSPQPVLCEALHRLVTAGDHGNSIFVSGHMPLAWYVDREFLRPSDQLFTVIRDPENLVLSSVNYILTRLCDDPEFVEPDTKLWVETLGISGRLDLSPDGMAHLAQRILHDPHLTGQNILCRYLGAGTAESAIDMIIRTDIEITDMDRYNIWFPERWNIAVGPKENVSRKIIDIGEFHRTNLGYLQEITQEDRILYQRIMKILTATGTPSIFGETLLA